MIRRRALLPLPALLLVAAAPALEADARRTLLRWPDQPGQLSLPSPTARTLALPPLAGQELTAIAFALQSGDSAIELLILAAHDGREPRLLAIEPLSWTTPVARLNTRPASGGDRAVLALARDSAIRASPTLWKRESWTDYLGAKSGLIVDAPVRKPLAETAQARLATRRARCYDWLAQPRDTLTLADLSRLGLDAASFDLS